MVASKLQTDILLMPTLLANLSEEKEPFDIKLAYKEKIETTLRQRETKSVSSSVFTEDAAEDDVELDLTGSPLGADFDPDQKWSLPDLEMDEVGSKVGLHRGPVYQGASLAAARAWLSGPVPPGGENQRWALADGTDPGHTLYLGSRPAGPGLHSHARVCWRPAAPARQVGGQLAAVRASHAAAGAGAGRTSSRVECEYRLAGGGLEGGSSLTVRASWTRLTALLEPPPPHAAATLELEMQPGDEKLPTARLWGELQLLAGLQAGLTGNSLTWLARPDRLPIEDLVADMMEAVRASGPRGGTSRVGERETADQFCLEQRNEEDFTDLLWNTLSQVESYQELRDGLQAVFRTIAREELRPVLYRADSGVARVVTGLVRGGEPPALAGPEPLQLLAECGREKLRRDYSHRLLGGVEGGLTAREELAELLQTDTPELELQRLHSLHTVVDIAALLQTFLSLPTSVLSSVVSSALCRLAGQQEAVPTKFSFPLGSAALQQLAGFHPASWQLKLSTAAVPGGICTKVDTVARIVSEPPDELPDWAITSKPSQVQVNEDNDSDKEPEYFMIIMNEIERKSIG